MSDLPTGLGQALVRLVISPAEHQVPVDLAAVASRLGVARIILRTDMEEDGKTVLGPGPPEIHLRRDRPLPRRRFTLAHELGHVTLADPSSQTTKFRSIKRGPTTEEKICDWFASSLLMPFAWARPLAASPPSLELNEFVANQARVSRLAAAHRLSQLDHRHRRSQLLWLRRGRHRWVLLNNVRASVLPQGFGLEPATTTLDGLPSKPHLIRLPIAVGGSTFFLKAQAFSSGSTCLALVLDARRDMEQQR